MVKFLKGQTIVVHRLILISIRNFYWTSNKTTVLTEDLVFGDNGNNLDHDGYFIFNNTGKFLIDNNSTVIIGRNSRINNYEYSSMNFGNASGANSNLNHIKLGGKLFVENTE